MYNISSIIRPLIPITLLSIALTNILAQNAESDETMKVFIKTSNEAVSYSLDELNKITFNEKGIQIWNTKWPTEYSYTNVRVLTFNCASGGTLPDAIKSVTEKNESGVIYDLQGRKLNTLKRGVNIVRMKDGTTRKVLLK